MTTQVTTSSDRTTVATTNHAGATAIGFALASAAAFGTSGPSGKALLDAGWNPAGAVTARVTIAALVLLIPALVALRGRWHLLVRNLPLAAAYGLTGIAGCQLAYFSAVERLSVGVALLLEYLSPLLIVLYLWARSRRSPGTMTFAGAGLCVAGLVLVLNVFGGAQLSGIGVLWGIGAAVCSAAYFVLAAHADTELPPITLAGAGMTISAAGLLGLGALDILPMRATTNDVVFAGHQTSFILPLLLISVVAAAFAYVTGVIAVQRLGATVASFVALAEVLFAVVFAWLLLGELPLPVQLGGGALIIAGVVLVRVADLRKAELLAD